LNRDGAKNAKETRRKERKEEIGRSLYICISSFSLPLFASFAPSRFKDFKI